MFEQTKDDVLALLGDNEVLTKLGSDRVYQLSVYALGAFMADYDGRTISVPDERIGTDEIPVAVIESSESFKLDASCATLTSAQTRAVTAMLADELDDASPEMVAAALGGLRAAPAERHTHADYYGMTMGSQMIMSFDAAVGEDRLMRAWVLGRPVVTLNGDRSLPRPVRSLFFLHELVHVGQQNQGIFGATHEDFLEYGNAPDAEPEAFELTADAFTIARQRRSFDDATERSMAPTMRIAEIMGESRRRYPEEHRDSAYTPSRWARVQFAKEGLQAMTNSSLTWREVTPSLLARHTYDTAIRGMFVDPYVQAFRLLRRSRQELALQPVDQTPLLSGTTEA